LRAALRTRPDSHRLDLPDLKLRPPRFLKLRRPGFLLRASVTQLPARVKVRRESRARAAFRCKMPVQKFSPAQTIRQEEVSAAMRHTRTKSLAVSAFFVLLFLAAHGARAQDERSRAVAPDAPEIAYTVSMRRPHTHMLEVE